MKKIDKKDLPKLIMLVVLSVGVFGYAAMTIFAPPRTSAATPPAATQQAAAAVTDPAQPDTGMDAESLIAIPALGKDPFVPNGPAAAEPDPADSQPVVRNMPPPSVPSVPSLPPARRGSAGGPPNWSGPRVSYEPVPLPVPGTGRDAAPAPMPVEPPPAPEYSVTGIVRGEVNVAILRGGAGGGERRFVRVGDPVGNGFVVAAIQANGVVIKSGDRRVLLKLGDDSRAN